TRYGINFSAYDYNALSVKPIGFDKEDFILSVGTDQHRDLELLDVIAKNNPDKQFVICSGNPEHHKRNFSRDNVTIIRASYNEMVYLYHACKFVVIPLKFNFHASGITTLLEAAAARKAVLLNYTPGLEDYGQHDNTCLFASLGDIESFDRNLNKLWDSEKLRNRLAENAYKYLHSDFNTYKYSQIYIELSKNILGI
ncbi:glycosyltransferase, partial [Escherichia coli]